MKRTRKGVLAALALVMLALLCVPALAADADAATVDFRVWKEIAGGTPTSPESFTFTLQGLDGAPMPSPGEGDTRRITITGEGDASFGEIVFTEVGTYRYVLRESAGNAPGYTYDEEAYVATVQVTWVGDDSDRLQCTVYIEKKNEHRKVDRIVFTNVYDAAAGGADDGANGGANGGGASSPQTGDTSRPLFWGLLFCVSAAGLASCGALALRRGAGRKQGN